MKQWFVSLLLGISLASCSGSLAVLQQSKRVVTPDDFVSQIRQLPSNEVEEDLTTDLSITSEIAVLEEEARDAFVEESVLEPTRVDAPIIVESLVGQVNGRPIFANEILEPIADQLFIVAEESLFDVTAFKNVAKGYIASQMQAVVKSELLLSEAKSGMTIEEKQGLFSYLQKVKEDMASTTGGSQSAVTRQLLDEEGKTVDEFLDYKQQQVLINQLLREKVKPHIQVTWRDVLREWEQSKQEFSTVGSVTLGMIRASDEDVAEIEAAFGSGASFASVATQQGIPNNGEWDTFEFDEGGLENIDVADSIKSHILGLEEEEVIGPVNIGSANYWFTILEMREAQVGSLWDPQVQLQLREFLLARQGVIEETRFLERILAEGSFDEFNAMVDRILHVAVTRYMH